MAMSGYIKLVGQKQGKIKGTPKKGPFSDGIEITAFDFGLETPFDPQSGQPTGKRKHKPIVITREVDSASPLLWQALCTNESFVVAQLSFARPDGTGKSSAFQTIELTNGTIRSITHSPNSGGKRLERITFDYDLIRVNGLSDVVIHRA